MPGKEKPRFSVVITRESVEEWTVYVSADSEGEANEAADELVQSCTFPDFELIHSEYFLDANPISPRHTVEPTRLEETQGMVCLVCLVCLRSVQWTGTAADDPENKSGVTIPGPWVHTATA